MKKLWRVTVNNWGWDQPRTFYATSRRAAELIGGQFPAWDRVEYAGCFNDHNANLLIPIWDNYKQDY